MVRQTLHCFIVFSLLSIMPTSGTSAADTPTDEFVQMIVKLIGDSDKEFRAAGLDQVRTSAKGAAATKVFASRLMKLDDAGQIALLDALADRGDAAALPAILELLNSKEDSQVRAAAISAIGYLGSAADLPLLIKNLSATSKVEQAAAKQSLVQLSGDKISKTIGIEMKSASPTVKAALIEVLATRRASDEIPAFVAATVDDNAQVRSSAMSAIGQIGRPEQIAEMLPGVLKAEKGTERDNAEKNVALVCSRIDNEEQRGKNVIDALNTVASADRDELLALVGRVGGKTLVNFVGGIAASDDPARRRIGIDALSKWPDATAADKLLEIVNKATDPAERHQAFQGFVKISAARDNRNDKQRLDSMKEAMKIAQTTEEKSTVINRTRTSYDVDAVRFVLPYLDQPELAQITCETIVEIAHHRDVRERNKAEFDTALDRVIEISKDSVVVDRAQRYKRGQTWERPRRS